MEHNGQIWIGKSRIFSKDVIPSGRFVDIDSEQFYRISNYHEMPDFFISIVSDSDHWMFISSNGSLSAGRKNRDNALFPYYTVDKIHDYRNKTGSKTYFLVNKDGKTFLWEPFTDESLKFYTVRRNLYKSIYGNKIIFEEINEELGLSFKYGWYNSEKFGFVKKSFLENTGEEAVRVEILEGLKNIIPAGVDYGMQNELSNELVQGTTLGLFTLSSIPIDRAEPSESLKATTVWSTGFSSESSIILSEKQISRFTRGKTMETEFDIRASRGTYFIHNSVVLKGSDSKHWMTIAEINQDSTDVFNLMGYIAKTKNPGKQIEEDINKGTTNLKRMVSGADGFQKTNTDMACARHYTNTLFNIMRGGIFADHYNIEKKDFSQHVWQINKLVFKEFQTWLDALPDSFTLPDLIEKAKVTANPDLLRISYEYLPLVFSRRHGDPSRPWNIFSIDTRNEDGTIKYNYEGNWRDIFQNWEALAWSYPGFIESFICRFVNASTIDGYNPYRIMRNGIDWECPDPDDPWSYIGYWGDHQIIYLQKFLELSNDFYPGKLDDLLSLDIFTYANVPYRIKSYHEIVKNPKNTVDFDPKLDKQIKTEVAHLGADAALLKTKSGDQIYKVNLAEKILATLLSKLSNFIPEAGIWMNTQRPEWNDANNALVGNGASMVTLFYLRRFLKFWQEKFNAIALKEVSASEELNILFLQIYGHYLENKNKLEKGFTPSERKKFVDFSGIAHEKYRNGIYGYSFSGEKSKIKTNQLADFCALCISYIDQSIRVNKRNDGLYHAYNLITIKENAITIRHLYEMLEGQVAVLSSGYLSADEGLGVLDALKKSKMFRPDQYSYLLYPDRQLPRFIEKNIIPEKEVLKSPLLKQLVENNESSIIKKDEAGHYHFNASFRNVEMLEPALDKLRTGFYSHLIEEEKTNILSLYEEIFDHQSFTGRSGTFYGYEGLGSIYWHMVSKLLLATAEYYFKGIEENASPKVLSRLKEHYYEIKAGIGLYKEPGLYGAFPTDAYSHTPGNAGVKQPGLTGQVKEDFISRMMELGIQVRNGQLNFNSALLNEEELPDHPAEMECFDLEKSPREIALKENQLAFTFCQVPVVYTLAEDANENIIVTYRNGDKKTIPGNALDGSLSAKLFNRTGGIERIDFTFNTRKLSR